eukprot:403369321
MQNGSTVSSVEKLSDSMSKLKKKLSLPATSLNIKNKNQLKVTPSKANNNTKDVKLNQKSESSKQLFEMDYKHNSKPKISNQKHKNHKQRRLKDNDSERSIPVEQYQTPTEDIQEERTSPKNSKYDINKNIIKISE